MDWANALHYTYYKPGFGKQQCWIEDELLMIQESCALGKFSGHWKGAPCPCGSRVHLHNSPPSWRIIFGPPKVRFASHYMVFGVDVQSSNVVAYSMDASPPLPYRLKSSSLRFQIPDIGISKLLPDTRFIRAMRDSQTWQTVTAVLFSIRTWTRATILGDRVSPTSKIHLAMVLTATSCSYNSTGQQPFCYKHAHLDYATY